MKIVSKQELMEMPVGTPFREYTGGFWPDGFDIFAGKSGVVGGFHHRSITSPEGYDVFELIDHKEGMAYDGESHPVYLGMFHEFPYDSTTRYLIWEPDDVRRIIDLLQGADKDERDDRD